MRKLCRGTPARELMVGAGVSRNQFDGNFLRLPRPLGKKDRAMLGAAQPLPKRKFPVGAALPLFPCLRIAHERLPREQTFYAIGKKPGNAMVLRGCNS